MQNHLRINCHQGFLPLAGLCCIYLVYVVCISLLNIELQYRVLLLVTGLLLIAFSYRELTRNNFDVIRHDGTDWYADLNGETVTLKLHPESYVSRFLVVPVFTLPTGKKKYRLYFAHHNCSIAEFRQLSRLLLA